MDKHVSSNYVSGPAGSLNAPAQVESIRDRLLQKAGITEQEQVALLRAAWRVKRELLDAKSTKYFPYKGRIVETRTEPDNAVRMRAVEHIDRFLGVVAPRADQEVIVVHRLEMPSWALADTTHPTARVIDVPVVEPDTNAHNVE